MLTKVSDIPQNILDILARKVLMESMPKMFFRQFVDYKLEFGLAPGERVRFIKVDNINGGGKLLDEDTPIPTQKMTGAEVYATLNEFGNSISFSRRAASASLRNLLADAEKLLVRDYAITLDTFLRDVAQTTANKYYPSAAYADTAGIGTVAAPFDKMVLDTLVEKAKGLEMPKLSRGADSFYAFIGTSHQIRQIRSTRGWLNARQYVDPKDMLVGEAGRLEDVIFFDTNQMQRYANAGAGAVNVHRGIFIGADSIGYGESVPMEIIPGDGNSDFKRKVSLAWYTIAGAAILTDNLIDVYTAEGITAGMQSNINY